MSVTGNIIGMPPGAGGSFPMAGTRPKLRKTLTVTSGSIATWAAPPNVYHIILEMCGAGGGGSVSSAGGGASQGGGGGAAIPPSVIPVNPGSVYRLVAGLGGVQRGFSIGDGFNGTPSEFTGDILRIIAPGGRSGSNSGPANSGSIVNSSLGYIGVNGGPGGVGFSTGSRVENQPGGAGSQYGGFGGGAGGGGASLYASGSNAGVNATGFGAGGGAGFFELAFNGGSGGPGFVRIIWEE